MELNKAQFPESLKGFQRRGIALPETSEQYNQASTDLVNMRKSGEAAAHGALVINNRNSNSFLDPLSKRDKQTIKIRSN